LLMTDALPGSGFMSEELLADRVPAGVWMKV
jgi:hypothetical protein